MDITNGMYTKAFSRLANVNSPDAIGPPFLFLKLINIGFALLSNGESIANLMAA